MRSHVSMKRMDIPMGWCKTIDIPMRIYISMVCFSFPNIPKFLAATSMPTLVSWSILFRAFKPYYCSPHKMISTEFLGCWNGHTRLFVMACGDTVPVDYKLNVDYLIQECTYYNESDLIWHVIAKLDYWSSKCVPFRSGRLPRLPGEILAKSPAGGIPWRKNLISATNYG